jgi:LuxR family maltose regulon positive regulatory protein
MTSAHDAGRLLETKIHVPAQRRAQIARPRLRDRLRLGLDARLTLVSAPAGFGKTTLLADWIASLTDDGPRVAWLSLDPSDSQPTTFWTYVIGALRTLAPEVGVTSTAADPVGPRDPAERAQCDAA